jgi:hypothetical protein
MNSLKDSILKHVNKKNSGCWEWLRAMNSNQGVIGFKGKTYSVRKSLFKIYYPFIEIEGYLRNSCSDKKCVNPEHQLTRDQYFWTFISKNPNTNCWEWTGQLKGGYGYFSINHKDIPVHRLMFKKYKGIIPPKINVCHSCDNPKCCNPDHLWLGTQADNIADMHIKKRDYKSFGENHHTAKINENNVREIRKKYKEGMKMKSIHRLLNIPYRTIQHVCTGNTWKHIKD